MELYSHVSVPYFLKKNHIIFKYTLLTKAKKKLNNILEENRVIVKYLTSPEVWHNHDGLEDAWDTRICGWSLLLGHLLESMIKGKKKI